MNGKKAKRLRRAAKLAAMHRSNGDLLAEKYIYKQFKKHV